MKTTMTAREKDGRLLVSVMDGTFTDNAQNNNLHPGDLTDDLVPFGTEKDEA